jgi:hypothetical protein
VNSIKTRNLSPTLNKLTLHNSIESILTPKMVLPHHAGKFLPKTKVFFPHDFTLIASVVGESVIGHSNGIRYSYEFISYILHYVNSYKARLAKGQTLE